MKWDDAIIKFEWTFEMKDMLENMDWAYCEKTLAALQEAAVKLKFNFNAEMVAEWNMQLDNDEDLYEKFEDYIIKNAKDY